MMGVLYISGYIEHQHGYVSDDDTTIYYKKFGKYLNNLNRGGLCVPHDGIVQ